jgi:hypothetical protein
LELLSSNNQGNERFNIGIAHPKLWDMAFRKCDNYNTWCS